MSRTSEYSYTSSYYDDELSAVGSELSRALLVEQEEEEYDESIEDIQDEEEEVKEIEVQEEGSKKSDQLVSPKPFDIQSGSFMSFIQGEGPTDITKAAGQYFWNVHLPGWIFRSNKERGVKHVDEAILLKRVANLCCDPKFTVRFAEKLQYNTIQRFEDDYRIKATSTTPVTLQDVKDVVLYTALIDIPKLFIRFFHTASVDKFLRSLIVYMQYLVQVCRAMKRRRDEREYKLWHPNTLRKYQEWKVNLDLLRFILGRNYFFLITGRPKDVWFFRRRAHPANKDYKRDKMLFELLYVFSQRVVELALYEKGNNIISGEIQRLFRPEGSVDIEYLKEMEEEQREVIESKLASMMITCKAPAIRELVRPNRILPFVVETDYFLLLGDEPVDLQLVPSKVFRILQLAYFLNEKRFSNANIRIGLLGYKRENFNPTLTDQTNQVKFDEAEIPLDTGLSFSDDPAFRYPEPAYLIPKMIKRQCFNLNFNVYTMTPQEDRMDFWLKNSKLQHRCISDFIMAMN